VFDVVEDAQCTEDDFNFEEESETYVPVRPPVKELASDRDCLPFPEMGFDFDEIEAILED